MGFPVCRMILLLRRSSHAARAVGETWDDMDGSGCVDVSKCCRMLFHVYILYVYICLYPVCLYMFIYVYNCLIGVYPV